MYNHFATSLLSKNFTTTLFVTLFDLPQNTKQDSYTKANESGEEAQKVTMRLIDIGLP